MNSGFVGRYKDGFLDLQQDEDVFSLTLDHKKITVIAAGLIAEPRQQSYIVKDSKANGPASIIVNAYLEWGDDFTSHILGQFCGAVIDQRAGQIILFQDSFGLRPLFYTHRNSPDELVFGTRLSDIAKTEKSIRMDLEYFADYLAHAGSYTERTPFQGISRLTYGACAKWRNGRLALYHPWKPSDADNSEKTGPGDMESQLIGLLEDSMAVLKDESVPVWCDVSGGLDSTTVFKVASRCGVAVEPFSIVSRDALDEGDTEILNKIFSKQSSSWYRMDVSDAAPFSVLPDLKGDEPGGEIGFAIRRAAYKLRHQHKVHYSLSGMGGDQVFGSIDYMPTFLADYLYRFSFRRLYRELRHWQNHYPESRPLLFWLFQYSLKPLLMHLRHQRITVDGTGWRHPYWIRPDFSRKYDLKHRWQNFRFPRHSEPGRNYLWQEVFLICAIEASSRSHAYSSDYYYPLLHRPLVEFMLTLPYEERRRANIDRVIQRRALKGILPDIVLQRLNKGTGQPVFDRSFREAVNWHDLLKKRPMLVDLGVFELKEWNAAIDRAKFGLYESLPHFCASVCCEIWLKSQSLS